MIPCYNSEAWIGRAIASVLDQSYADRLVVVVDDGSKDGSAQKVRAFGDRVILHTGPNRGACAARNTGMAIAADQGATHVIFLDADDYLEGELLAGAATVAAETKADIVLSPMALEYPEGRRIPAPHYGTPVTPEIFFKGWMTGHHYAPVAILLRIDFVQRVGGWDESLARAQDTEMFLRSMFGKPLIRPNIQGLAIYTQINADSVSRDFSPRSSESRLRVMAGLLRRMRGTSFAPIMPLLEFRLYSITREAFRMKQNAIGRQGLRELAALGIHSHPGSRLHRAISKVIGLEAKVRIWGS